MLQPGPNAAKLISGCCAEEAELLIVVGSEAFCHQVLLFCLKSNFDIYLQEPMKTTEQYRNAAIRLTSPS